MREINPKRVLVRPAHEGDGIKLAAVLREADCAELAATHPGQEAGECLEKFIAVSAVSVAAFYDKKPMLLAGIYHPYLLAPYALVWLMTGEIASQKPVAFVKLARFFLREWQAYYGELFNYVDARYIAAQNLISRLGGSIENDGTYFNGQLFLKCTFRRNLWEE